MMTVSILGLSKFLDCTFISTSSADLSSSNLIKLLYDFPEVGHIMNLRPRSITDPDNKCLKSTKLQLIEPGIIELSMSIEALRAGCCLSINEQDSPPAYLDINFWKYFLLS